MLLVTGATGYLGAALVGELVARGHRVRATVRDPLRATVLPESVERVAADLGDEESLRAAAEGCDGVFHVAAAVADSVAATRRANVDGTARVLRAAAAARVRRVVHTSSAAAIVDATGLVSERAPDAAALTDPYSVSKTEAEGVVLAAVAAGQDAVIVNVGSAYGPSPRGPQGYNDLLAAAARGEVREIVDTPMGWVLAQDVAAGHLLAYERGEPGSRYVLCGEVASFARFLNTYAALVGSGHRVAALPPGSTLAADAPLFARRSEVYGRLGPVRVDDAQARALGFAGRGIDEGLRLTADWMAGPGAVDRLG